MEGVLTPQIWVNVGEKTKIPELRLTARDEPNYDTLMKRRLKILEERKLTLKDIQRVIATMTPLDGPKDFLAWLRARCQVIILSDTFGQFAAPLMKRLHYPPLLCPPLEGPVHGPVLHHPLRLTDQEVAS